MNRFAIYTAVVGNYDEIRQPLVVDPRFDYYLFSNTIKEKQIGVWQIKPIEYTNPDQVKIARYVKTHPETLFPDYSATLWMDANIQIADIWIYTRFFDLVNQGVNIASIKHGSRDCIYEEIVAVCSLRFESLNGAHKWNRFLCSQNYPKHNGLFETGIVFRMNCNEVHLIDELWWSCIENFSRRDQLSFNYVLWEQNVECHHFFVSGETAWSSQHVVYTEHPCKGKKCKIVHDDDYLTRLWDYYNSYSPQQKEVFIDKWLNILRLPVPISRLVFFLWRQALRIKKDILYYLKLNG